MNRKIVKARYQQIAVELAERIVEGRYRVGDKIHARSTLASTFNVSPETARKAINVLVDLGIMEVKHGSGAYVASKDKAQSYLAQYRDVQSMKDIQQEIVATIETQQKEWQNLTGLVDQLINQTTRTHQLNPFLPFELVLTEQALHLEKTISELNLWQETEGTVVAIQTKEELLLSPGPYAMLHAGDILYFVGNEFALQRMTHFFYKN